MRAGRPPRLRSGPATGSRHSYTPPALGTGATHRTFTGRAGPRNDPAAGDPAGGGPSWGGAGGDTCVVPQCPRPVPRSPSQQARPAVEGGYSPPGRNAQLLWVARVSPSITFNPGA